MNIKLRAAINALGLLALVIVGSTLFYFLCSYSIKFAMPIFAVAFFGFFFYLAYDSFLRQLRFEENMARLKDMEKK